MRTFISRRYMRRLAEVGSTEKVLGVFLLLLLAGIVAAYVGQSLTNEDYLFEVDEAGPQARETAAVENPFPDPGVAGWRRPTRVSRFTPDNLYQKINGRADLYLQFQVVTLTFGAYSHQTDDDRIIDVYWYDMGKPENALGVYRSEAPEDAAPVSIGQDGYEVSGAVFFIKASQYVQVLPAGPDEADWPVALEIAKRISERIEGGDETMWALAVLPESKRVADSLEYLAEDAFGLEFLKDVFTAEYDAEGGRITLFIHRAEDGASANALLEQYEGYFKEYGKMIWAGEDSSRRIVAGEAAGVIDVVFVKGMYVGGVAGAEDLEAAKQAAAAFYDELAAP